jgi:hypothetical protein
LRKFYYIFTPRTIKVFAEKRGQFLGPGLDIRHSIIREKGTAPFFWRRGIVPISLYKRTERDSP